MLARTPSRTGHAASYDRWSCPRCSFVLTIVHGRKGTRVEYDVEGWARRCCAPERDSPLACPCVVEQVWKWLSPSEQIPAPATQAPLATQGTRQNSSQ